MPRGDVDSLLATAAPLDKELNGGAVALLVGDRDAEGRQVRRCRHHVGGEAAEGGDISDKLRDIHGRWGDHDPADRWGGAAMPGRPNSTNGWQTVTPSTSE